MFNFEFTVKTKRIHYPYSIYTVSILYPFTKQVMK